MAYEDMVRLGEAMEKKWNEAHPGVAFPDIDSKEFRDFCDEWAASNSYSNTKQKESVNVYEDDKHRYTKVDKNYIRKVINDWIDENPGKTISIGFLACVMVSCKIFQRICTKAVYKGNLRTIKYLMKHGK